MYQKIDYKVSRYTKFKRDPSHVKANRMCGMEKELGEVEELSS